MITHELMKLLTLRSTRVGALAVLALSAGLAWLTSAAMTSVDEAGAVADAGLVELVLRTSTPALIMAAVLGGLSVPGERRHGMLPLTTLRSSSRGTVLAAKAAALGVFAACLGACCAAAAVLVVVMVDPGPTLDPWAGAAAVVAHAGVSVVWALLGLTVGVLVPHPGAAVATVLAGPLLVEPLLVQTLPHGLAPWLPFRSAASLYAWVDGSPDPAWASLGAAAVLAGALVVAWRWFDVSDV